jgi:hypothetical protein
MQFKTLDDFKKSLDETIPPDDLSICGVALWWAGRGNWDKAHDLIQDVNDKRAYLIHAYLHRHEGDISNAQYWYSKANSKMPDQELDQEWEALVKEYL